MRCGRDSNPEFFRAKDPAHQAGALPLRLPQHHPLQYYHQQKSLYRYCCLVVYSSGEGTLPSGLHQKPLSYYNQSPLMSISLFHYHNNNVKHQPPLSHSPQSKNYYQNSSLKQENHCKLYNSSHSNST